MSQPLHKGVPVPGLVLPQRDKPALGQDTRRAFALRGAREAEPRHRERLPAHRQPRRYGMIKQEASGSAGIRGNKEKPTRQKGGGIFSIHPAFWCVPQGAAPRWGHPGSEGWGLLPADGVATGTRCLGQAGWVPWVPLCTSPSPPCCQQHLRGAPALTRVSFVLPKIVFHGILNRTSPLQSPYPLWQASTLSRNGIKTHPSSSPNLRPWQFNPSVSNPNTAGGWSHLLPPGEALQGKKLSSSPGSAESPGCRRSPTSPFMKSLCIS